MVHVDLLWSKVSSWCGDGTGGDWNGVPTWWQSFSPPEWTHFEFGYLVYRAGLNKMGAIALEKKQTRWRQRPKGHGLEHLVYDFHGLNPRYCSNFLDEDFVRRSKNLAIQSNARFVSKHVLFRYAIAATLRWTDLKPEWEKNVLCLYGTPWFKHPISRQYWWKKGSPKPYTMWGPPNSKVGL